MNKQTWADLLDAAATALRKEKDPSNAEQKLADLERWASERILQNHNRFVDHEVKIVELQQKVDVLNALRGGLAELTNKLVTLERTINDKQIAQTITDLAERVDTLDGKVFDLDQHWNKVADLSAVFEITKHQVAELQNFRQMHSRFHDQMDKDMDHRFKETEKQSNLANTRLNVLERRLTGDRPEQN